MKAHKWRATFYCSKVCFAFCSLLPHLIICPSKNEGSSYFSHYLTLPLSSQPTKLSCWITNPVMGSWIYLTLENSWDTVKWDVFCASWIRCLISTHSPCQLEGEGLNPSWWFISVQLSHQLWSHIVLVFSLRPLLSKLCHPLTRTGCWCLARTSAAACILWNKCSQLSTAKQPDNRGMALATGKSEPASLCWDTSTQRWNASSWGLLLETLSLVKRSALTCCLLHFKEGTGIIN